MIEKRKTMEIPAIEYGTVIDHIPADVTLRAMDILGDSFHNYTATLGTNFPSKRMGKKGFIKIEGAVISQDQANKIAIIAPKATFNLIKDGKVIKKSTLELPDIIEEILKCPNPECITNHAQAKTNFHVLKEEPLSLRCHYCERTLQRTDLVFK
ncbi:MAG: aspartate carbamoyltransferase regulatory subunit [Nanoarchaeota archaeon]